MKLYYINHKGEKLYLSGGDFTADGASLFDWEFEEVGADYIIGFCQKVISFKLPILIQGHSRAALSENLKRIHDVASVDIANMRMGKLWIEDTDEYLPCYLTGSSKSGWGNGLREVVETFDAVTDKPGWHKDYKYTFSSAVANNDDSGLDYEYDYPYDYTYGSNIQLLDCETVEGSDFELVIYGPATNPEIHIGENIYAVGTGSNPVEVYGSGYITVNSINSSVLHTAVNGQIYDIYNDRVKDYDIFAKIPPGKSVVQTNCFFDLYVKQKRNEPTWNLQ
ncbi:MAG: hypothetical protein LBS91_02940 [Clostridiales Family XIII bacterium]|jgi:hypothetical protein|nr:hypothetical protein [Clostridiales Family XIII bacterium]